MVLVPVRRTSRGRGDLGGYDPERHTATLPAEVLIGPIDGIGPPDSGDPALGRRRRTT
jgi:hypothetical protein